MSLCLRRFTKPEIAGLKAWFPTEEDVLLWAGASLSYPVRDRDIKALIKAHSVAEPVQEIWTVIAGNETCIGHLQIAYNHRLHQATLGRVAIAPDQRGKGYATALVQLAVIKAFERNWINRIELRVYDHNARAISAYLQAGFVYEGKRRQSTPINQTYWNTDVMSILRSEYQGFDKRTEGE